MLSKSYIRTNIISVMKSLTISNMNSICDGNISFYGKNSKSYFMTKIVDDNSCIHPDDVVEIDISLKLNKDYFEKRFQKRDKNIDQCSPEVLFHDMVIKDSILKHGKSRDICVIHCHPPESLAFMGIHPSVKNNLRRLYTYFPHLRRSINIGNNISRSYLEGNFEYSKLVAINIANHDIIGHENHGLISTSQNLQHAYNNIKKIEYYSRIYNTSVSSAMKKGLFFESR